MPPKSRKPIKGGAHDKIHNHINIIIGDKKRLKKIESKTRWRRRWRWIYLDITIIRAKYHNSTTYKSPTVFRYKYIRPTFTVIV